jgi:hypothetical protein
VTSSEVFYCSMHTSTRIYAPTLNLMLFDLCLFLVSVGRGHRVCEQSTRRHVIIIPNIPYSPLAKHSSQAPTSLCFHKLSTKRPSLRCRYISIDRLRSPYDPYLSLKLMGLGSRSSVILAYVSILSATNPQG